VKVARVARLLKGLRWLRALKLARMLKFVYALYSCKLPSNTVNSFELLEGVAWTTIVVVVALGQFLLISFVRFGTRPWSFLNLVLGAIFVVEVCFRLGLYCQYRTDPWAYFKLPINVADAILIIADTAYILSALVTSQSIGEISSTIKLLRCVRILKFFPDSHVIREVCGLKTVVDSTFLVVLYPPTAEEMATRRKLDEIEVAKAAVAIELASSSSVSDLVSFTGVRGVKYADGTIHQGDWLNGLEDGAGQLTFSKGDKFKGNFRNGLKHGRGLFDFSNGDQFRGTFSKDQKHGFGTYSWADGDRFEATYNNGKEDGKATFYSTDGRVVDYHFKKGVEVPAPQADVVQKMAADNFKSLNFKEILTPGSEV
jgi:hypothetical protein